MYPYCYRPIIRRNTPLPITRTERYVTAHPHQTEVDINIFQGDDPDALKNIPVGDFRVSGLAKTPTPNEVLCRMSLDLDGILKVSAIERQTGKAKHVTINNSLKPRSDEELAQAQRRLRDLFAARAVDHDGPLDDEDEEPDSRFVEAAVVEPEAQDAADEAAPAPPQLDPSQVAAVGDARGLLERSRKLLDSAHPEDREEMIDLHEQIEQAIEQADADGLTKAADDLKELLFFIEGK